MTDLGTIEVDTSEALALNDKAQVVGELLDRFTGKTRGFIWSDGIMTDIGTLGGDET